MPAVQEKVKELTGKDPHRASTRMRSWRRRGDSRPACSAARSGRPAPRRHPLTLGIETKGGVMTSSSSATRTTRPQVEVFSTAEDNQPRGDPRPAGRAPRWRRTQVARQVPADGIPPAPRASRRSRSASTSTPTASSACRRRTSAPARSRRSRSAPARAERRRDQAHGLRRRGARRRTTVARVSWPSPQQRRERRLPAGASSRTSASRSTSSPDRDRDAIKGGP